MIKTPADQHREAVIDGNARLVREQVKKPARVSFKTLRQSLLDPQVRPAPWAWPPADRTVPTDVLQEYAWSPS